MNFMEAVKRYGKPDFAAKLKELVELDPDDVPLEDLMLNAGWVNDDGLDVTVMKFSNEDQVITAHLMIFFSEDHPSSCAHIVRTDNYRADCVLTIDMETGEGEFDVEGHEREPDDNDDLSDEPDIYVEEDEEETSDERDDRQHRESEF